MIEVTYRYIFEDEEDFKRRILLFQKGDNFKNYTRGAVGSIAWNKRTDDKIVRHVLFFKSSKTYFPSEIQTGSRQTEKDLSHAGNLFFPDSIH